VNKAKRKTLSVVLVLGMATAVFAQHDGWPRWRGPEGNGISGETTWRPDALKNGPVIVWQAAIGVGFSSVSIADGIAYAMGNSNDRDTVFALDAETGDEVWAYSYAISRGQYPGPRATPSVDGDRVYTLSREGHVFCFASDSGGVLWQAHLAEDYRMRSPGWGFAGSPLIDGDLVIFNTGSAGMALNKHSGERVWSNGRTGGGYSTPVAYMREGERRLAVLRNDALSGVETSSGKVLWSIRWGTNPDINGADPVILGTRAFVATGYGKGAGLIDFSGKPYIVWESRLFDTHFSSFVLIDGFLYGNDGDARRPTNGTFRCIEFASGEEQWSLRGGFGSLIAAGDHLIMLNSAGEIIVAEADPRQYREVARGALPRNQYWSPPSLADGRLYIRNIRGDLYCVDMR
jgi:outer membrane protein assembly factor BamB